MKSVNPVNGNTIKKYEEDSLKKTEIKLLRAERAWTTWKNTSFEERAQLLRKIAATLGQQKESLAALMATEMGKPLKAGIQEVEKCADACMYYADHGAGFLEDIPVSAEASKSFVCFQPIGTVLAIMPWNFPFWQVFRFLAPALMAGNCAVLKHASNVPGCALAIESVLKKAGTPAAVFQTLLVGSKAIGKLIAHPVIKAVTLTGSTEAGRKVARQAGEYLKKTVLELGGSDAYVVLADADLEAAATICTESRLINNGQSCIAAKRFVVVKKIEKEFVRLFMEKMRAKTTGDPFDAGTDLGPMARIDLRDELHRQVMKNIRAGAKCVSGGTIPGHPGKHAFYMPTLLTGIKKGMPAYEEELFGPVASVITAKDTNDAIRLANDSTFGLGAAVLTADKSSGERIARERLEAGSCFVNAAVKSDPRMPFGGIKNSGYGRELGLFGIREFVNIKTVYIG